MSTFTSRAVGQIVVHVHVEHRVEEIGGVASRSNASSSSARRIVAARERAKRRLAELGLERRVEVHHADRVAALGVQRAQRIHALGARPDADAAATAPGIRPTSAAIARRVGSGNCA